VVERYFTIEEYLSDIDATEVYQDCKWGKLDIAMQPDNMITVTPMWIGTGAVQSLTGASAPYFTTPSLPSTTAVPLAAIDATVRLSDEGDLIALTAFQLSLDIGLNAPAVAASKLSPDVFSGILKVSGSITVLVQDVLPFADFIAETPLSLSFLAKVPNSSPTDFYSFVVPNFTLGAFDKSEIKRDGGPRTVTLQIPAELVGIDQTGGAYDATMIKVQRST
jgi:hypothetical protein